MSLTRPRRYWLTGAGNGLGAALAEQLLKAGVHLAVSARNVMPLKALAQNYPGQVLVLPGDLTNSQTVREIGEQIMGDWGSLDTVILNAGTCEYVEAKQYDPSFSEHVVRTNLLASSFCIDAALPLLRAGTAPHLVGIASPLTQIPLPRSDASGNAKAGLRHLFESVRIDLAPEGIEVTVASPGTADNLEGEDLADPAPLSLVAERTARHIVEELKQRPLQITLPSLSMPALWPLSGGREGVEVVISKPGNSDSPPADEQP